MTLKSYLFRQIIWLLVALLNIFSLILIHLLFLNSFNQNKAVAFQSFANIYAYIKSETSSLSYLTDKELLQERAYSYLNLTTNGYQQELQVLKDDGQLVYQSESVFKVTDAVRDTQGDDIFYLLTKEKGQHFLVLSRKLILKDQAYDLIYFVNVEETYHQRRQFFIYLGLFNAFVLLIASSIIRKMGSQLSRPLHELLERVQDLAQEEYSGHIQATSTIAEIQSLTAHVNIMSQKISQHVQDLELKNQQQDRFISALTHEIRTPLTAIVGYSSLYKSRELAGLDVNLPQVFEQIHDNGKRIEQLSENLVRLISLDKEELSIETIDLKNLLEDCLASLEQRLVTEQVDYKLEESSCLVQTDAFLLRTLVMNIIDNAIKASRNQLERQLRIKVTVNQIRIADNGSGMTAGDVQKIFEPFYTVDQSRASLKNGFGLGMSLVHDIAKLLHLTIEIESELGQGTEVIIDLKEVAYV